MSGSVNDLIANPAAAKPIDWGAGFRNLNALREVQSQNAQQDAYRNALLPDGTFDQAAFNRALANDPRSFNTGAAVGTMLQTATGQQDLQAKRNAAASSMLGAVMALPDEKLHDGAAAALDRAVTMGLIPQQQATALAMRLPNDPAALRSTLNQIQLSLMGPDAQRGQTYGQTTLQNIGGQLVPVTVTQPGPRGPGAVVQGPGSVTTGLSPGEVFGGGYVQVPATDEDVRAGRATDRGQQIYIPRWEFEQRTGGGGALPPVYRGGATSPGVRGSDGKPVGPANPPRLLRVPGSTPAPTAATPAPAPAAPALTPAPASPPPPAPAPAPATPAPATAPPAPPAPPPAPAPAVSGPAPTAPPVWNGRGATVPTTGDLDPTGRGGVQVASAAPIAPTLGPAAPPSPAVAGDVAAMMRGMGQAPNPAPGTRGAGASIALGPGYDEQVIAKQSSERLAADSALANTYETQSFPYMQALKLYGRGMTTAPGSDFLNAAKGFAGGVARSMGFSGAFDSSREYDELHKWLANITSSNPLAAGSDARLAQTLAGNANTGIHNLAGEDMLKAGIAMMRMQMAAVSEWNHMSPQQKSQNGGYYTNFRSDLAKTIDPRAFAVDLYNDAQKETLRNQLKQEGEASAKRFMDSYNMANRNGFLTGQRAMP
jgi:hypothetical protein